MNETKRVLFSLRLWGLLALLLALNCTLTAARDPHMDGFYGAYAAALPAFQALSPEQAQERAEQELAQIQAELFSGTQDRFRLYLRQEVLQALSTQLVHLADYPIYLEQVQANVRQMSALSVFSREGSFSARNIEQTGRDFPTSVALRLDNDFAVTMLVTDGFGGWSLLALTLYLALQFAEERKRGLWSLVHGAPEGRGRLAAKRSLLLLAGVTLGTLVLTGGKLAFGAVSYGGLGDLSRNVQSLAVFSDFPWVMSVRTALLWLFLLRILGAWLVGLAVWAILQAVGHLPLAIGASGVVLTAEYALFRFIPDSYGIVILRYINLFALADVPGVALHYLNLNLFGRPVQGFLLSLGLIPPLLGLLIAANLLLAQRKKPVARQNALLALADRLRVPFSAAVGRLRLLGYELYKLLWLQKGVLVLLAVAWFSFSVMETPYPDAQLYDTELAGLSASMEGPITEDTLAKIDEKLTEYASWEPSEAVLRQLELLERLREKVAASLDAQDGLWLINQAPFAALMGRGVGSSRLQNAAALLLALVLLLGGTFAQEKENRMTQLLRGAPRGRGVLLRRKLAAAAVLTAAVWLIFEAGELYRLLEAYGSPAFAAPLQSFDALADLPVRASLGAAAVCFLLLRLLWMLAAAGAVTACSRLCRRTDAALLTGCAVFVLPVWLLSVLV